MATARVFHRDHVGHSRCVLSHEYHSPVAEEESPQSRILHLSQPAPVCLGHVSCRLLPRRRLQLDRRLPPNHRILALQYCIAVSDIRIQHPVPGIAAVNRGLVDVAKDPESSSPRPHHCHALCHLVHDGRSRRDVQQHESAVASLSGDLHHVVAGDVGRIHVHLPETLQCIRAPTEATSTFVPGQPDAGRVNSEATAFTDDAQRGHQGDIGDSGAGHCMCRTAGVRRRRSLRVPRVAAATVALVVAPTHHEDRRAVHVRHNELRRDTAVPLPADWDDIVLRFALPHSLPQAVCTSFHGGRL